MHMEVNSNAVLEEGSGNTVNQIPVGRAYLIQAEQGKLASLMSVLANLAQGQTDYWTSEPCKSEDFLWKKSLSNYPARYQLRDAWAYYRLSVSSDVFKPYLAKLQQENIELPPTVTSD